MLTSSDIHELSFLGAWACDSGVVARVWEFLSFATFYTLLLVHCYCSRNRLERLFREKLRVGQCCVKFQGNSAQKGMRRPLIPFFWEFESVYASVCKENHFSRGLTSREVGVGHQLDGSRDV